MRTRFDATEGANRVIYHNLSLEGSCGGRGSGSAPSCPLSPVSFLLVLVAGLSAAANQTLELNWLIQLQEYQGTSCALIAESMKISLMMLSGSIS